MTIDAAHRAPIYEKLRPILGDEDANVLMSEFPSVEAHELVTKDFLRAELALTKGELRDALAELRDALTLTGGELREELALTKGELRAELALTKGELRDVLALTGGELREELTLTKGELRVELAEVRSDQGALETRVTVRLGSAIAASTALLAAIGLLS